MDSDLEEAYNTIMQAVRAEDIFGDLVPKGREDTPQRLLDESHRRLKTIVNPENYRLSPEDMELAIEADLQLKKFYERAQARVSDGIYGVTQQRPSLKKHGHLAFKTDKREYYIGEPIAEGTLSTIFDGECAIRDEFAGRLAIKIANEQSDNDFIWRELRVLKMLHEKNGAQRKHLPVLLDHFTTSGGKAGLILRYLEDCQDFCTILARPEYAKGVDRKHMVWMLNRLLSAVGYAHSLGIVHCNITPEHLMVHGPTHNITLIDWCWSAISPAKTGDQFKIADKHFSAPEVERKNLPHPASDIYSIGKCMIHILGGNVETNEMPDTVEEELQRFIQYLVMDSMVQRPHDAWYQWRYLDGLVRGLWGKKKFIEFSTK